MSEDLKKIKKYYGEEMMHFCRSNFPTILEQPGLLFDILDSTFAHDKNILTYLGEDELNLITQFIFSYCDKRNIEKSFSDTNKTVEELLKEKDYDFYECKTFADTQKFKKYFRHDEELCTFRSENRTLDYYVTFAVKKNAESIKRKDNPQRQDDYGTSVISIQINKNTGVVSIKNRYNHTVSNPDATFANNLEAINTGLTKAFEKKYNIKINTKLSANKLYSFVLADDGKLYRYNTEDCLIYYCHNNIVIDDGKVITDYSDKGKYLFADSYIINLQKDYSENRFANKHIFTDYFRHIHNKIDKIEIKQCASDSALKNVIFQNKNEKPTILTIDECGNIISYVNPNVEYIGSYFMEHSLKVKHISMENVKKVEDDFCPIATKLASIEMPNVLYIGNHFAINASIKNICFPNVIDIGYDFISGFNEREIVYLPKVEYVGDNFLNFTYSIDSVIMDSCTHLGEDSFRKTKKIGYLSMSSLEEIPKFTLCDLKTLNRYNLSNLKYCSPCSLDHINYDKIISKNMPFPERVKTLLKRWWA